MRISVVIPLYNKSSSITRCILSVINQLEDGDEIIVVDDGSTDESFQKARSVLMSYSSHRYQLITQANSGVSAARNLGISVAKSEYICLLDADDQWRPAFLTKMKDLVSSFPEADLYCLGHEVVKGEGPPVKPKHGCPDGFKGYVNDFFRASAKGSVANSSKVSIRKTALEKVGGFPVGVVAGEDLYVWIRLALNGLVACDPSTAVVTYLEYDRSRSSRIDVVPYPLVFFGAVGNKRLLTRSLRNYLFMIASKHIVYSISQKAYRSAFSRWAAYFKVSPGFSLMLLLLFLLPPGIYAGIR